MRSQQMQQLIASLRIEIPAEPTAPQQKSDAKDVKAAPLETAARTPSPDSFDDMDLDKSFDTVAKQFQQFNLMMTSLTNAARSSLPNAAANQLLGKKKNPVVEKAKIVLQQL